MKIRPLGWLFEKLNTPSKRWGAGLLLVLGAVFGIAFSAGFETFVASTGTEEFCISCHEMKSFPFAEYQQSVHYGSRSGVRPICSDCHVPKAFIPKIAAKIRATFVEVPAHFMGKIDTPEKFEAKRDELAKRARARMEANDSAGCRSCHNVKAMDPEKQSLHARREHEAGFKAGQTCIDCHMGIAHHLPDYLKKEQEKDVDFDF